MTQNAGLEAFKPIPIRAGAGPLGRAGFMARMAVDLQLLTCWRFLSPALASMHGAVLDVGCGEMPFRGLLPADGIYTGIDVPVSDAFGMRAHDDIVSFDGLTIPFPDNSFDHVVCTEVLEHAQEPARLIAEMRRVLRPGGTLALTMPFSARVHHMPHDYQRFTRFGLELMFRDFAEVTIAERGDDIAVIANKLIVLSMRLLRPSPALLGLVVVAPAAGVALLAAHLSLTWGLGSKADPLGYGVLARKTP